MRDLGKYSASEWLQALPLSDAWKQLRNDVWQSFYNRQTTAALAPFLQQVTGRHLGIVVAFEQPWALNWQLSLVRKHVPGLNVLVFDNSHHADMRTQISKVCQQHGVPYLGLPRNRTRHVNRSHGMAMNWIYQKVIYPLQPETFMFIDHDMIPVSPNPYPAQLVKQPIYGRYGDDKPWSWQFWAGYCAFRFDFVRERKLNFLYDFSNGLDTGGRNWRPIYRHFDPKAIQLADQSYVEITDPLTGVTATIEMVDHSWFHIGGISYNNTFHKKSELCLHLAEAMAAGASWGELCPASLRADKQTKRAPGV